MSSEDRGLMFLINRQIDNYKRLAGLIEDEQKGLMDLDLDLLQETVKAKEEVAGDIRLLVQPLAERIQEFARKSGLPADPLPTLAQLAEHTKNPFAEFFRKSGQTLARLKRDISRHNQDNRSFIQETLGLVENFLSILTGVKLDETDQYQQTGLKVRSQPLNPLKLNREV
ncbi:MAG: flagellar export chaperone FlgN [Deltaproteobacteria bacterium]|nr:flagellar export chaperone FlgN [Deltaproteobacteria bacterium]